MKRARWWMRRRWWPRMFAEYMATPEKIGQRDRLLAMCDAIQRGGTGLRESIVEALKAVEEDGRQ